MSDRQRITVHPYDEPEREFLTLHNVLFDVVMPSLSANAWKVLCVILRKTRGWQRNSDEISYSQIMEAAGIGSDHTVTRALKELEAGAHILAHRANRKTTTYALNRSFTVIVECRKSGAESAPELPQKVRQLKGKSGAESAQTERQDIKDNKQRGADAPVVVADDESLSEETLQVLKCLAKFNISKTKRTIELAQKLSALKIADVASIVRSKGDEIAHAKSVKHPTGALIAALEAMDVTGRVWAQSGNGYAPEHPALIPGKRILDWRQTPDGMCPIYEDSCHVT